MASTEPGRMRSNSIQSPAARTEVCEKVSKSRSWTEVIMYPEKELARLRYLSKLIMVFGWYHDGLGFWSWSWWVSIRQTVVWSDKTYKVNIALLSPWSLVSLANILLLKPQCKKSKPIFRIFDICSTTEQEYFFIQKNHQIPEIGHLKTTLYL